MQRMEASSSSAGAAKGQQYQWVMDCTSVTSLAQRKEKCCDDNDTACAMRGLCVKEFATAEKSI